MAKCVGEDAYLSDWTIRELAAAGAVRASVPFEVEPASIDVRALGAHHLVPFSFLPAADEWIEATIDRVSIATVRGDTRIMPKAACVTLTRLDLQLDLPADVKAVFSPKSSIGRIDLNVRVMTNGHGRYDETPFGYKGGVWAELRSSSFPVQTGTDGNGLGAALTQVRFVRAANRERPDTLLRTQTLTIAVGEGAGWIADLSQPTDRIVLGVSKGLRVEDFWRPIRVDGDAMILRRGEFYIARSRELLTVGSDECSVLRQVEPTLSMASCHMAGFVDSGWGLAPAEPGALVFEIRNPENDMMVRDGQPIGVLETHRLDRPVSRHYGAGRESYQGQGVRLARCFEAG